MTTPQRSGSDIEGLNVIPPDRVPAVDLRDQQYRNQQAPPATEEHPEPAEPAPLPPTQNAPSFTAEQIEKARREEREKVLKRLEREQTRNADYQRELEELRTFRETAQAEKDAKDRAEARKAKKEAEKDLTAKERLDLREQEWERQRQEDRNELLAQMEQMRQERAQEQAQTALERSVLQLQNYITTKVGQAVSDHLIAPQFVRFINGTSQEQVDGQIADAITATEEILAEVAGQQQSTAPPVRSGVSTASGPSSMGSNTEVTSEPLDYTKLSLKDYIEKVRPSLQIDQRDAGIFS